MEQVLLARVAVSAAAYAFDKPYDYIVPPSLAEKAQAGVRVTVPFGRGNKRSEALILSTYEGEKKPEHKALDPCWTASPSWTRRRCAWPSGCGSGISAPSMTR